MHFRQMSFPRPTRGNSRVQNVVARHRVWESSRAGDGESCGEIRGGYRPSPRSRRHHHQKEAMSSKSVVHIASVPTAMTSACGVVGSSSSSDMTDALGKVGHTPQHKRRLAEQSYRFRRQISTHKAAFFTRKAALAYRRGLSTLHLGATTFFTQHIFVGRSFHKGARHCQVGKTGGSLPHVSQQVSPVTLPRRHSPRQAPHQRRGAGLPRNSAAHGTAIRGF